MVTRSIPTTQVAPLALPELEAYLEPLADVFRSGPTRRSVERYVTGLFTDSRKTCGTMAQTLAGTSTERLQHLLTDAKWDAAVLDEKRVRRMSQKSPRDGVLILDDTGQAKQGDCSVGVARQYSGTLGKIGNCQVIVTAQYMADDLSSSAPLHWPVSARLYLPEAWAADSDRRRKAHIPREVAFRTKPQIALDLVDQARDWDVPFRYVVADAGYGDKPHFLASLEERQLLYVCGVSSTFGLRRPDEVRAAAATPPPEYQGAGRPRMPRPAPFYMARQIEESIPDSDWHTISWREGTKGTLTKRFAAVRVHRGTGNPCLERPNISDMTTGPEGWLLIERPIAGEKDEVKYYYSNLPADTPLERLVALAHARWVIELFYREAKGECGLDRYQGRRWDGLHRHLALVMLSYSFLVQHRLGSAQRAEGLFPLDLLPDATRRTSAGAELATRRPDPLAHGHWAHSPASTT